MAHPAPSDTERLGRDKRELQVVALLHAYPLQNQELCLYDPGYCAFDYFWNG